MTIHDPFCTTQPRVVATPDGCNCRELRVARLQGPVNFDGPRHAPLCWCNLCLQASEKIHGSTL